MRKVLLSVIAVAAVALAGCGGSGSGTGLGPSAAANRAARRLLAQRGSLHVVPAPPPTGRHATPGAVRVIRGWSDALRAGHVEAAARYFSVPSQMINPVGAGGTVAVLSIASLHQAIQANETLPCGARFVSADQRGPYVNALFKLTGRPGAGGNSCASGAGQTARTNFLIADGRIVQWIRAPDDPGDNGSAGGGSGGGGPVV